MSQRPPDPDARTAGADATGSDRPASTTAADYAEILYQVDDPVAVIMLNRPQSMNAWTTTMDIEIRDALDRAANDRRVVGIVLTGAGRAFCAGADMSALDALSSGRRSLDGEDGKDEDSARRRYPWAGADGDFDGRLTYLMGMEKPIIAAVNGAVAGMAYPLALACDLRVVTPDALFVTAFAERGLIAEWGLSWLLPRLVGPAVALDLLMSSRRVNGEEAVRLGLANQLVDADHLLAHCRDYIEQLAARCSPSSIAIMKRQVYQQLHRGLGQAEVEAQRLMMESFHRPDFAEGVQSFLQKRPPTFARLPLEGHDEQE